jgi:hypothetical protein
MTSKAMSRIITDTQKVVVTHPPRPYLCPSTLQRADFFWPTPQGRQELLQPTKKP